LAKRLKLTPRIVLAGNMHVASKKCLLAATLVSSALASAGDSWVPHRDCAHCQHSLVPYTTQDDLQPEKRSPFRPVALSHSPREFAVMSLNHIKYAVAAASHPKTFTQRYAQSPFARLQDISESRVAVQVIVRALITYAIFTVLALLVMTQWSPADLPWDPEVGESPSDPAEAWSDSPFNSFDDPRIFRWALCCPGTRWAQTSAETGFMPFWVAFWSMSFLWLIKWIYFWICTWFLLFDLTGILVLLHRRRLRGKLKAPTGWSTCAWDCCMSFFCAFNVIVHEAKVAKAIVEQANLKKNEEKVNKHQEC